MNNIEHDDDLSTDDRLDTQRDIIRQSLDAITNDIGYGNARCRPDLPTLHHRSELWRRASDHCDSA